MLLGQQGPRMVCGSSMEMVSVTSRTDSASLVMTSFLHTCIQLTPFVKAAIQTVPWLGPLPPTSLPQSVPDLLRLWEVA